MSVENRGQITFNEKLICGVSVDIYSIMMGDKYDPQAIPKAWQEFWRNVPPESRPSDSTAYGGSCPIETDPGTLQYVAGVEVADRFVAPNLFELCTIPAGDYLQIEHIGSILDLATSYQNAYGVEFPKSGLSMRPAPHLEEYDATLNPMDENYRMGILIPINSH
jgi:predicted transcriptional regulator YdeE